MKRLALVAATLLVFAANAQACPTGTTVRGDVIDGKQVCTVKGKYLNSTLALSANYSYVLEGDVRIGGDNANSSNITIEPGTTIYGTPGSFLVIMRGSQIFANGTAGAPVVFTSLQRDNLRPGLWGGVVINGNAPINNCKAGAAVCESENEGIKDDTPKFGGNKPDESSGSLKYVRFEYAGFELSKDNELNALTLYGVGSGTEVDYVEALRGADDGIEVFGGTVNLRHILIIDNDDDGLDWDMGWTGNAQFVFIDVNQGTEDSNGIEADNLKSPMTATPRSNPTLSNVTIVGRNAANPRLFSGILLRRGTSAQIYNTVVTGNFNVACVNIDDAETFNNGGVVTADGVRQTGVKMDNSVVQCAGGKNFEEKAEDPFSVSAWFLGESKSAKNLLADPMLINGRLPAEDSPVVGAGVVPQIGGAWQFTKVDFIGAFSPYVDEDWAAGWSTL